MGIRDEIGNVTFLLFFLHHTENAAFGLRSEESTLKFFKANEVWVLLGEF
jgi:hypothetical protein